MTTSANLWNRLGHLGLLSRCAVYMGSMLIVGLIAAPVAHTLSGSEGLWAATAAGGVCLASGLVALALSALFQGPSMALYGMLIGMLVRMGLPLLVGGALHLRGGDLAVAGLLWYLTAFYFVTLVVDTALVVAQIRVTQPCVVSRSAPSVPTSTVKAS